MAALIAVVIILLVIPNVANITAQGPMLELPLILSRTGQIIPHEEVRLIQYRFNESPTNWEPLKKQKDMSQASQMGNGFRIYAPFTITKIGLFGKPTTTPLYRSLSIHIELIDGTTFSMSIPVISDKSFDSPIHIDFESQKDKS